MGLPFCYSFGGSSECPLLWLFQLRFLLEIQSLRRGGGPSQREGVMHGGVRAWSGEAFDAG